jgi:hypothetical protein
MGCPILRQGNGETGQGLAGVRALSDYNVEFNVGQFGACLMDGGLTCLS